MLQKQVDNRPEELAYLWSWYAEVASGQQLTYTEIRAWADLTSKDIAAWEVQAIMKLDRLYWSKVYERNRPS